MSKPAHRVVLQDRHLLEPGTFASRLPFSLDEFQRRALDSLDKGRSVLVAAPTGSGKTVVAEYAMALALKREGKAFYTTPLKALSNQKYVDLVAAHGRESVGLLTGDVSLNGDAPIVVMTTEVLRNMIYEASGTLGRLRFVILDEVHYLQNPYRGSVWEEVIVNTPPEVLLVCLSATVSNAEEVGGWLTTVRGRTDVVIEERRPVSLENLYMVGERRHEALHLLPVFVGGRPNGQAGALDSPFAQSPGKRGAGAGVPGAHRPGLRRVDYRAGRMRGPRRVEVVDELSTRSMLPAIYFIFSRDGCDRAAVACLEEGVRLTSAAERRRIRAIAEEKVECLSDRDLTALGFGRWLACLESGVAAHHAGLVPPFKEAVESCFAEAAVKVVFATETLSLGINMPARTVVIEKLTKFTGEHHARLTPGEYTQLTGRAGRRGIDEVGYGIVLWSPIERFATVASLASARTYELTSSFRPSYNMVANLVRTSSREGARHLLNLSFAQFRADKEVVRLESQLASTRSAPQRHRLQAAIDARSGALSTAFDAVAGVLASEGCLDLNDWSLSPRGERLARIYHESDLLVLEAMEEGILDGLGPADMAAMVSFFVYEERGSTGRVHRRGARDLGAQAKRGVIAERGDALEALARRLKRREAASGVDLTRSPEAGFAPVIHRWTSGADLDEALRAGPLPGGDFVRWARQVADLLRQIADVAASPQTQACALSCLVRLWRGVVAASSLPAADPAAAAGSAGERGSPRSLDR